MCPWRQRRGEAEVHPPSLVPRAEMHSQDCHGGLAQSAWHPFVPRLSSPALPSHAAAAHRWMCPLRTSGRARQDHKNSPCHVDPLCVTKEGVDPRGAGVGTPGGLPPLRLGAGPEASSRFSSRSPSVPPRLDLGLPPLARCGPDLNPPSIFAAFPLHSPQFDPVPFGTGGLSADRPAKSGAPLRNSFRILGWNWEIIRSIGAPGVLVFPQPPQIAGHLPSRENPAAFLL